jgi:phytoene dehydrogenase-like protein
MNEPEILIIGAGVAGLSAGCYAQANGYSSLILEMHSQPGGLCTAWQRKDYTFDYCIHWLVGSGKAHGFRKIWDFLGMIDDSIIIDPEIFQTWRCSDGTEVHWYTDAGRLQAHLEGLANNTGDRQAVAELSRWIRKMGTFILMEPDFSPRGLRATFQSLPALRVMREFQGRDWMSFAGRITTPVLREAFTGFFAMEGFPLMAVLFTLGNLHAHNAGYPRGGSLPMAKRAEATYRALGGSITYNARVQEILVEHDRAVGVRCADGSVIRARWIVSAADAHTVIHELLGGRYRDPEWDRAFAELKPFPGPVQVSYGVRLDENRSGLCGFDLTSRASVISLPLHRPLTLEGKPVMRVGLHHYAFDQAMGPAHGIPVTFLFAGDTAWWQDIARDQTAYRAEKERLARDLAASIDAEIPGFAARIEAIDVATPLTNIRYTGNWQGAQEGFMMGERPDMALPATLPGLANFRLAGQWLFPGGGLPPSAKSGRDAIKTICRAEHRRFRDSRPT